MCNNARKANEKMEARLKKAIRSGKIYGQKLYERICYKKIHYSVILACF
ncbi:hypothetical protein BMETH_439_0 [methanotrophic bacterial endosymbiont of Bathymodiolus sp.]|nr:hypothetical protein BMETH_439_0 [methanotrophic bacterial endosymbiont of Bathymodiolus sp.]